MCIKCHSAFTNESLIEQLKESLKNPEYHDWDSTSIGNVLLCISTGNKEVHNMANTLMKGYLTWLKGITNGYWEYLTIYRPKYALENIPSIQFIEGMVSMANTDYEFYRSRELKTTENSSKTE